MNFRPNRTPDPGPEHTRRANAAGHKAMGFVFLVLTLAGLVLCAVHTFAWLPFSLFTLLLACMEGSRAAELEKGGP